MTVEAMRTEITKVYPGPTWRIRVQSMKDDQVIAIYKHMQRDNVFKKAEIARKKKAKMKEQGVQMTIWDFLADDKNMEDEVKT